MIDQQTGLESGSTSELFRRILLAGLVALLVARPVVSGEDPGLSAPLSEPSNLVLTQLWLALAAGWFCWRLWADVRRWIGGLIDLALLLIAGLMFLSASQVAPYRHPAWLIAWEWTALLAAFTVVRQLAVTDRDRVGLFSALLAAGVMLSVAGLVQWLRELPALAQLGQEKLSALITRQQSGLQLDPSLLEQLRQRIEQRQPSATFRTSTSLTAFLLLIVPGLIVAGLVTLQQRRWWRLAFVTVAIVAGLAALYACQPDLAESVKRCSVAWKRTLPLLEESPWLGIGPGNFGREYRRQLQPGDGEPLRDAPDLFLDLASSAGVVAALLLFGAIILFFFTLLRRKTDLSVGEPINRPLSRDVPKDESFVQVLPWEFYFGGMFGLLLGMLLRLMGTQSADEIWYEGIRAVIRSAVWFVAFAVLERIPWSRRALTAGIGLGVLAMLLYFLVAPGICYPSLAFLLWTVMALGLNSVSIAPNPLISPRRVLLALVVPVVICLPISYFFVVLSPITSSAGNISLAQARGQLFLEDRKRNPKEREILEPPLQFIRFRILELLNAAAREDPGNARIPVMQAEWYREMWYYQPSEQKWGENGLQCATRARELDPHGQEPLAAEAQLRRKFASRLAPSRTSGLALGLPFTVWLKSVERLLPAVPKKEEQARTQYVLAAEAFTEMATLDPTAAPPHFWAADCWYRAGDRAKMQMEARKALDLDEQGGRPAYRLSDPQREQVRYWLAGAGQP